MHSSLTICSLFFPFLLNLLTSKKRKCWKMLPLRALSSESSRKAASIVLLWVDDSLEFGSASFCNHLSSQAEYEWRAPKYPLEGHGNFLETLSPSTMDPSLCWWLCSQEEALEAQVWLWAVRRGQGEGLCAFAAFLRIFFPFCSRVNIMYFGSSFFASIAVFR